MIRCSLLHSRNIAIFLIKFFHMLKPRIEQSQQPQHRFQVSEVKLAKIKANCR